MTAVNRSHNKPMPLIVRDPSILGGEPTLRGTRIAVRSVVLADREFGGVDGVRRAYPQLDLRAIKEALAYYETHQEEVDHLIAEDASEN